MCDPQDGSHPGFQTEVSSLLTLEAAKGMLLCQLQLKGNAAKKLFIFNKPKCYIKNSTFTINIY